MGEERVEAKQYIVIYKCECGGEMKHTGGVFMGGEVFLSNPPKYPHKCDKCGERITLNKAYPTTELGKA